jgi:hypothetical protein
VARDDRRIGLVHVLRRALPALAAARVLAAPGGAVAAGQRGVTFRASLGDGARLGHSTALTIAATVDPELTPLTSLRILTPAGIDLVSSGLGVASCHRPASEIATVMIPLASPTPCPQDSVMGTGNANAALLVEPRVGGVATLTLHAADSVGDKPGLVVIADTYNPARFHLVYQGYLYVPPAQFGVGVAILVPQIPSLPFGVPIALTHFRLNIGDPHILYDKRVHGRTVRYRPRSVTLPRRCPRHGFRFRLIARFADGARRQADAVAACPKR